jgi:hypothetical protein
MASNNIIFLDDQAKKAYLCLKFACFNKPEQDHTTEYGRTPFIQPPFEDPEQSARYNDNLSDFIQKPFEEQMEVITATDQHYWPEATIMSHLVSFSFALSTSYEEAYTDDQGPRFQTQASELFNQFKELPAEKQLVLFHLFDILYNNSFDLQTYPFLDDYSSEAYERRIDRINTKFMFRVCDNISNGMPYMEALEDAMLHWWNSEQQTPSGLRVCFDDVQFDNNEDMEESGEFAESEEDDDSEEEDQDWEEYGNFYRSLQYDYNEREFNPETFHEEYLNYLEEAAHGPPAPQAASDEPEGPENDASPITP